jgi:hypothetical protein
MYSDVVPHREDASDEEWKKWDKASEMQLYESENPWDPGRYFIRKAMGAPACGLPAQIPISGGAKTVIRTMLFRGITPITKTP